MNKLIYPVLTVGILSVFILGCGTTPTTDEQSNIDSQIFLGDWFDHYNRARRELLQGEKEAAKQDLLSALSIEPDDKHRKRTYGVRFQSYYPHRELGVLYLKSGDYRRALHEFDLSLKQAPTSRCKYYRNEALRIKIRKENLDRIPPEILLEYPADGFVTNQRTIDLAVKIQDDTSISEVWVNQEPEFIELAEAEIEIARQVELRPGKNLIKLVANDLNGRQSEKNVQVELDIEGPVFSLSEVRIKQEQSKRYVLLKGTAVDRNTIEEIRFGSLTLDSGRRKIEIDQWFPLKEKQATLDFALVDIAGNKTVGEIDLRKHLSGVKVGKVDRAEGVLVASADPLFFPVATVGVLSLRKPVFDFGDLKSPVNIYQDEFYINGKASWDEDITSISCNNEALDIAPGTTIYFAHFVYPEPGSNVLSYRAKGSRDWISDATLILDYHIPEIRSSTMHLKLAMYDFDVTGSVSNVLLNVLDSELRKEIEGSLRFNNELERVEIERVLVEQGIGNLAKVYKQEAYQQGQMQPADILLFPRIIVYPEGFDIYLHVVDVQFPDRPIARLNVYQHGFDIEQAKQIVQGLFHKLMFYFPMLEGKVIAASSKKVMTDLNLKQRLRPGMFLYVFRGMLGDEVGLVQVTDVKRDNSIAKKVMIEPEMNFQEGDTVLTK